MALLALSLPAVDAVAQGRLSKDIARKVQRGDATETTVIVTGTPAQVDMLARRHGLRLKKRLRSGAVLDVPAGTLAALTDDADLDLLSSNQILRSNMGVTNTAIGADQAWESIGPLSAITGEGVGVAVIDSGIANVPALRGRLIASLDFTDDRGKGIDKHGHGTHVAGIIGADGQQNNVVRGVAPGAHLVSLKVLDADGRGTADDVIQAIDWVAEHHEEYQIRVINLSLGGAVLQSWMDDPICHAVARAYEAGVVTIASAGNFGKTENGTPIFGGITVPGSCPHSITVGALNTKGTAFRSDDEVATYSSRGPTLYDRLIKPDIVAPGNKIQSLVVPGSTLAKRYPELVTGRGVNGQLQLSGTSMAAAVVSGAVALLMHDEQPALTPALARVALQFGAEFQPDTPLLESGAGSLNVLASLVVASSGPRSIVTSIVGQRTATSGLVFGGAVVWGETAAATWGETTTLIRRSYDDSVVWGEYGDSVVWGEYDDSVVWGE